MIIEIIKKVREKVGNEYIVGIKINSEDGDKNEIFNKIGTIF